MSQNLQKRTRRQAGLNSSSESEEAQPVKRQRLSTAKAKSPKKEEEVKPPAEAIRMMSELNIKKDYKLC